MEMTKKTLICWCFSWSLVSCALASYYGDQCRVEMENDCKQGECSCNEIGENSKDCLRVIDIPCTNGDCDSSGCVCRHCWMGKSCDQPRNEFLPTFTQPSYGATLSPTTPQIITIVKADDEDLRKCSSFEKCPCGEIHYSILSGNENNMFKINPQTGDIEFIPSNHIIRDDVKLLIGASNSFQTLQESQAKLLIQFTTSKKTPRYDFDTDNNIFAGRTLLSLDEDVHSRRKRSIPVDSDAAPFNVTFMLKKTKGSEGMTNARVGDKIWFNLTASIPVLTTTLKIEISTEHDNSAIFSLCSSNVVAVGTNIQGVDKDAIIPQKTSDATDGKYNRIVFDFGTINNTGISTGSVSNNQLVLEFSAVVENHPAFTDGEVYWVGVGAQYDYTHNTNVWVGQSSLVAVNDTIVSSTPPAFNLTGPSEVMKGTVGTWRLEMTFYNAATDVILDVFAPVNDTGIMSICRVSVLQTGDGVGCLSQESTEFTFPNNTSTDGSRNVATFDLGSVVNTLFREGGGDEVTNKVVLEISAMMLNTSAVQTDTDYWLGVSVEVDASAIWAAQVVTTATEQDSFDNMTASPTFSLSPSHDEVPVGGYTAFILNMTLPEGTSNKYHMEMAMPFNGTAVMEASCYRVKYVGYNFPCVDKDINATYESQNNDGINDYITVDFGVLTNTGLKNDMASNTISIEISAKMLHNSLYVDGDTAFVTAGVGYNNNMIWVGRVQVKVRDTTSQPTKVPQFSIMNIMNNRDKKYIYDGGQSAFYFDIQIPSGTFFPAIKTHIKTPLLDGSPVLEICRTRIVYAGVHIPCWDDYSQNRSSEGMESSLTEGVMDTATVNLTQISSVGTGDYWWNVNDSVVRIEVVLSLRDHPGLTDLTKYHTTITVNYGGTSDWSGNATLQYKHNNGALSTSDDQPEYSLRLRSNSSTIKLGGAAVFDLDMTLTPRTITNYVVDAIAANNSELSICRIAIKSRGDNIPCTLHATKTQYIAYDNDTHNERAVLDMKNIGNIGQEPKNVTNKPSNTMTVEIVAMLRQNSSASNGDQFDMAATVKEGTDRSWLGSLTLIADTSPYNKSTMETPHIVMRKKTKESSVTKGAAAVFVVEVFVPPASMGDYYLEVYAPFNSTDIGKMSLCDVRVVSAGWNIPCINDTWMYRSATSQDQNFTLSKEVLDLSTVINSADTGDIQDTKNKVTVEIVVHLPPNSTAVEGDTLNVAASMTVNSDTIWVAQVPFTVTENLIPSEAAPALVAIADPPEVDVWRRIGGVARFSVNVTLPEMTTNLGLRVDLPFSGAETYLTVHNVTYTYRGENIGCRCDRFWKMNATYMSSVGTSQNDKASSDCGFVSNVGTTRRYQFGDHKNDDDVLRISFDVQVTQHPDNLNGSLRSFTYNIDYSNGRTETLVGQISVLRNDVIEPDMQLFLFMDESDSRTYKNRNQGEDITIKVHANHTWNSSAYAYDVYIQLMIPEHLTYDSVVKYVHQNPVVNYNETTNFLRFYYPKMMFSDNETLWVSLTIDPNKFYSIGTENVSVTIVGDIVYNQTFKVDQTYIEFDFYVAECNEPLGLANGSIHDCQIKASSSFKDFTPNQIRLNGSGSWATAHRGSPFVQNEYIQVNFGNYTRVTGISFQGHNGSNLLPAGDVHNFSVQYSLGGFSFLDYVIKGSSTAKIFSVTFNETGRSRDDTLFVKMSEGPLQGRSIRIVPTSNSAGSYITAMRIEVHGCHLTGDRQVDDICPVNTKVLAYERGYLVNDQDGILYVCMISNVGGPIQCSYTKDEGDSWTAIDQNVVNIDFFRRDTNRLYGLAQNRKSRLRSDDGGSNWCTISDNEYSMALGEVSDVLQVKTLPFDEWESLGAESLFNQYGFNINDTVKFSANVTGVHVWTSSSGAWSLVSYWGDSTWL